VSSSSMLNSFPKNFDLLKFKFPKNIPNDHQQSNVKEMTKANRKITIKMRRIATAMTAVNATLLTNCKLES
jgi:hypothetical protein